MRTALMLAARGLGSVWPNPAVGCVVVKEGRVVGRGWTAPAGRPHAEPQALARAGTAARGAAAYVTLEPCAHHGRTPPCTEALIQAGVVRVVVALTDPDPRVNGKGIARLRAAGIEVTEGVCEDEAREWQEGFLNRIIRGRPMLTLKLATSFDGRSAMASGESRWITGAAARRWVHAMRMRHDAVLVGAGTARIDDPLLTVRGLGRVHQPVRVVVSRLLDVPTQSRLGQTAREGQVWLCHGPDAPTERLERWAKIGARLLACKIGPDGRMELRDMLCELGKAGLTRVFGEGGPTLAAALLKADLVDRLIGITAGVNLGAEGQPVIGGLSLNALSDAPRFRLTDTCTIDGDVAHQWSRLAQ